MKTIDIWTDGACSIDPASCSLSSETCTAPGETRVIGGVAVTRPCWERTRTYLCQSVVGGGNDCGALEAQAGCSLAREVCLDDPPSADGSCAVSERVYSCPIPGTSEEPAQYICGGDVYCVNGDCEAVEREASDEFKDAVVALNAPWWTMLLLGFGFVGMALRRRPAPVRIRLAG